MNNDRQSNGIIMLRIAQGDRLLREFTSAIHLLFTLSIYQSSDEIGLSERSKSAGHKNETCVD